MVVLCKGNNYNKFGMGKNQLSRDSEFVVGENKGLNYVLAAVCVALFLYGAVDAIGRQFKNIDYQSYFLALALIPAWHFFKRGQSKTVYIRVNKTGLYEGKKFVTGWSNLIKVYITQKEKTRIYNIQDNFILVVEYWNDTLQQGTRRKIPLTNSQNKSEEEVLEAIQFFWKEFR
jgi:hypothetical protein